MTADPMTETQPMAPGALPDLSDAPDEASPGGPPPASSLAFLADVEIDVTVELGRKRVSLSEVARLGVGSVIELDTLAGEPLYRACGYAPIEHLADDRGGVPVPLVRMGKALP